MKTTISLAALIMLLFVAASCTGPAGNEAAGPAEGVAGPILDPGVNLGDSGGDAPPGGEVQGESSEGGDQAATTPEEQGATSPDEQAEPPAASGTSPVQREGADGRSKVNREGADGTSLVQRDGANGTSQVNREGWQLGQVYVPSQSQTGYAIKAMKAQIRIKTGREVDGTPNPGTNQEVIVKFCTVKDDVIKGQNETPDTCFSTTLNPEDREEHFRKGQTDTFTIDCRFEDGRECAFTDMKAMRLALMPREDEHSDEWFVESIEVKFLFGSMQGNEFRQAWEQIWYYDPCLKTMMAQPSYNNVNATREFSPEDHALCVRTFVSNKEGAGTSDAVKMFLPGRTLDLNNYNNSFQRGTVDSFGFRWFNSNPLSTSEMRKFLITRIHSASGGKLHLARIDAYYYTPGKSFLKGKAHPEEFYGVESTVDAWLSDNAGNTWPREGMLQMQQMTELPWGFDGIGALY